MANTGKITQIIGAVLDVKFEEGHSVTPFIYFSNVVYGIFIASACLGTVSPDCSLAFSCDSKYNLSDKTFFNY